MAQGSLNPNIRSLGQKVCPVACWHTDGRTDGRTDTQSDYCGYPFRVSGFFPSTYHQGSAQYYENRVIYSEKNNSFMATQVYCHNHEISTSNIIKTIRKVCKKFHWCGTNCIWTSDRSVRRVISWNFFYKTAMFNYYLWRHFRSFKHSWNSILSRMLIYLHNIQTVPIFHRLSDN